MEKTSILIADDHSLIREGMKLMVAAEPSFEVLEASNSNEVMAVLKNNSIDVLVLDISMPGKNGLEALKDVKSLYPKLPVLILSTFPEEQYAFRSLKAGASGYLTKDSAPENLMKAIKKVLKGEKHLSDKLASKLINEMHGKKDYNYPHELLSDREFEVLRMLGSGKTPTEIADELFLSVKTVSTYRTRILEKFDMRTTAQLIQYAIENKLC